MSERNYVDSSQTWFYFQSSLIIVSCLLVMIILFSGIWGPLISGYDSESITKIISVKDKAEVDGKYLIYTANHEVFSINSIFMYREIEVNETYLIEYRSSSKDKTDDINGQIINFEAT